MKNKFLILIFGMVLLVGFLPSVLAFDTYINNTNIFVNDFLGVGTTSPSQTLYVNGTFAIYNKTGILGLFQSVSGRVGIGTTNPLNKLAVANNNINGVGLELRSDDTTLSNADYSVARLFANFSSTNYVDSRIFLQTATNENAWKTGLVIKNGSVGIGTSSPAAALEVNGSIIETCSGGNESHRWTAGNNHCYIRFTGTVNISVARKNCQNIGGYLVTVTTAAENDWVVNTFGSADVQNDWIGLSDIRTEGTYEWVTGELAWEDDNNNLYTDWNSGEPNDSGGEDCVAYVNGNWNDYPCDSTSVNGYICEKDW